MIDTNLFQNPHLFWHVVILALVIWIVFLWKEWSNPIKNRFYLFALISLITIVSFAMLALKPLSNRAAYTNTGVLLTSGYSQKHLDSLKENFKGSTVLDYQENLPIGETLDSIRSLFVLGNGVEPYDFWQFENRPATYLGAYVPNGIIELKYGQKPILGENLIIKGKYHSEKAPHKIVLQDDNGQGLDSVMLNTELLQNFELSTELKATGKFVFQMVEKDSLGETILSEPLPFKVVDKSGLKILVVNGFPTFETKYLKNYLSEMGHEVVVRSQLTRGRYKFEYLNTQRIPIYRLDKKALESFDLLIIDGISFRNLSTNSWKSIEETIRNTELGLFVQPESNLFGKSSKRLGFEFERDGIGIAILNEFPKLRMDKFPYQFKDVDGTEEIHSSNEYTVTAYKRMEQGRIGTTLIQSTYQLQLDGKTETYRRFWAEVVNKVSKKKGIDTGWEVADNFPLENHQFQFELRTRIEAPKVFSNTKNQIALRQHTDIPSLWSGITYPKVQGWNTLHLSDKTQETLDFFVVDSTAWHPLRSNSLQKKNRRFFTKASAELHEKTSAIPINPLWFFIVSVLGMGFLWLHPKIFRN